VERTQRGAMNVDEATKIPSFAALAVVHGCERTTSTTSWRGRASAAHAASVVDSRGAVAGPAPAPRRPLLDSRQPSHTEVPIAADRARGRFAVSVALEPNTAEAQLATTVYACEPLPKHHRSVVRGRE